MSGSTDHIELGHGIGLTVVENKMDKPKRASYTPFHVDVEAGKAYFWCSCGLSNSQPFCDGSHKDTGFSPLRYDAQEATTLYFCGCKATASQPFCDGSHKKD
jgi:CDGSH-type Zn-finger protein